MMSNPLAAQQFGRFDMLGITDRLVFGPDPGVIGDLVAPTPDLDSPQVGGDLDAPTDRDRVHRVVVAIDPHVVITWQPCRVPPPDAWPDGRQRQHRRLIGPDPVSRSTSQHPVSAMLGPHQPLLQLGIEIRW